MKSKDEKAQEPVQGGERLARAGFKGDLRPGAAGAPRAGARRCSGPRGWAASTSLAACSAAGCAGKPYSAQGAKSGQFAYYVCASLFREGAGACTARYLNAREGGGPGNPEGAESGFSPRRPSPGW